jgi:regulator of cell morphogenesis and NO signaling
MEISKVQNIGKLVAGDYRAAAVFKKYGIDFCCHGDRSIESACEAQQIDCALIIAELNQTLTEHQGNHIDFKSWSLDLLADYIEKNHHRFVRKKIEEITPYLSKIVKVHGSQHPELLEVLELFNESASDLTMHMQKEEKILFPFIRQMVESEGELVKGHFGSVQNPIAMMNHEHDIEGDRFRKIAALTNHYNPPADACGTYRVTFALLKEFEDDLHLHIHLENNILFPGAIKLEASLTHN